MYTPPNETSRIMSTWMKTRSLSLGVSLIAIAWLNAGPVAAWGQEGRKLPETVSGTFEDNQTRLSGAWRLLSDLAVPLLSGNEAELLSGNETNLLSENDTRLLSGNKITLFSHNTLQIHITESGNNNVGGHAAPVSEPSRAERPERSRPEQQARAQQAQMQALQARLKAAESKAKALQVEKEKQAQTEVAVKLHNLQMQVEELAEQNRMLKNKLAELEAANQ